MRIDECPKCKSTKVIQHSKYRENGQHSLQQEYAYECLKCGWYRWSDELETKKEER